MEQAILCWYPDDIAGKLGAIAMCLYLREVTGRETYTHWPGIEESLDSPIPTTNDITEYQDLHLPDELGLLEVVNNHTGRINLKYTTSEAMLADIPTPFLMKALRELKWSPAITESVTLARDRLCQGQRDIKEVVGIHAECSGDPTILYQGLCYALRLELPTQPILLVSKLEMAVGAVEPSLVNLLLLSQTAFRYYSVNNSYSWIVLLLSNMTTGAIESVSLSRLSPRLRITSLPSGWHESEYSQHDFLTQGFYEYRDITLTSRPRIVIYSCYAGFDDYTHPLLQALCVRGYHACIQCPIIPLPNTIYIIFGIIDTELVLPPGKVITVQLEQWGTYWFTEEYLERLRSVHSVWEFSKSVVSHLQKRAIDAFYVPLGRISNERLVLPESVPEDIDILFYGCINSRRQLLINALQAVGINVRAESSVFGTQKHDLIQRSKLILNIHYYEHSATEQLRIIPCLKQGKLVISETSKIDQLPIAEFATGSEELVQRCQFWLSQTAQQRRDRALELYLQVVEFDEVIPWVDLECA